MAVGPLPDLDHWWWFEGADPDVIELLAVGAGGHTRSSSLTLLVFMVRTRGGRDRQPGWSQAGTP